MVGFRPTEVGHRLHVRWYHSLRFKALVTLAVVLGVTLGVSAWLATRMMNDFGEHLEGETLRNAVNRFLRVTQHVVGDVTEDAQNYPMIRCFWDLLNDIDHWNSLEVAFSEPIMTMLGLNYAIILRTNASIFWSKSVVNGEVLDAPPSVLLNIYNEERLSTISDPSPVLGCDEHGDPIMAAAAPIRRSGESTVVGFAVLGQKWDETWMQHHIDMMQVCVTMQCLRVNSTPSDLTEQQPFASFDLSDLFARKTDLECDDTVYHPVHRLTTPGDTPRRFCPAGCLGTEAQGSQRTATYIRFRETMNQDGANSENNSVIIRLDLERDIASLIIQGNDNAAAVHIGTALTIIISLVVFLNFMIIRPILCLSKELHSAEKEGDSMLRPHSGTDEISALRCHINALLCSTREGVHARMESEAKDQFITTMTHELRNPLHAVIGMLSLLVEGDRLEDDDLDCAQTAQHSADHLLNLINNVLDMSKLREGKLALDSNSSFNPRVLIEDCVAMFFPMTINRGLTLSSYVSLEADVTALGDPLRLRQVLINFMSNALKFCDTGYVYIRATVTDKEDGKQKNLVISVEDTGIGIEEEDLIHLFKRFSQVDSSSRRCCGGAGVGLFISKELVSLMGGEVSVSSRVGKGSVFTFSIPLNLDPPQSVVELEPESGRERMDEDNPKIRVHCADPAIERSICEYATELGYTTVPAESSEPCAIVVIDETLASGHLPPRTAESHVILMSCAPGVGNKNESARKQADVVVRRPIVRSTMISALRPNQDLRRPPSLLTSTSSVPQEEPTVKNEGTSTNLRILIAEDDPINVKVATHMLRAFQCEVVSDGLQVIEAVQEHAFDLILMDCNMPLCDGFTATSRIRALEAEGVVKRRHVIIALSANVGKEFQHRCREAGMDDSISKPVRKDELLERIFSHVRRDG